LPYSQVRFILIKSVFIIMGKYTKQTAALKATTIDARQIKAK
jgi:hypothetical protein